MKFKINPSSIAKAAIKEFAPDILDGMIEEWVQGKDTKEVHNFILNLDLWNQISPNRQKFLISYKPWRLDWLTPEWVIRSIAKYNKPGALLIMTSPSLQEKITQGLAKVKKELE